MKPYILGAICVWLVCGIAGAWLLEQQRVDLPTIRRRAIHVVERPQQAARIEEQTSHCSRGLRRLRATLIYVKVAPLI